MFAGDHTSFRGHSCCAHSNDTCPIPSPGAPGFAHKHPDAILTIIKTRKQLTFPSRIYRAAHRVASRTANTFMPSTYTERKESVNVFHPRQVPAITVTNIKSRDIASAAVVVSASRGTLLAGAHSIAIVLAHKQARQLPQGSHVVGFEDLPNHTTRLQRDRRRPSH